ncbi:MAG: gluconokinase [Paracoccus sp. (in: a-proteobacteria)]
MAITPDPVPARPLYGLAVQRIVVMGISGCGKSTLATALARHLGWPMIEGDALHPPENIAAMQAGQALTDDMRLPWLTRIADRMEIILRHHATGVVASCSALKRIYRQVRERHGPVLFLHLILPVDAAHARMISRKGHFMSPLLADSQAAILEPLGSGENGLDLDAAADPDQLLQHAMEWITFIPGRYNLTI